jgi:hypothetical protein
VKKRLPPNRLERIERIAYARAKRRPNDMCTVYHTERMRLLKKYT